MMPPKNLAVAVGLSGGVDSAVAALLLKQQGYPLTGITMKIWDGQYQPQVKGRHSCFDPDEAADIEDVKRVCEMLDIPCQVFDLRAEYQKAVLEYFQNEYLNGRTPNPCVVCNRLIKFEALLKKANSEGFHFDFFATGHYVRGGLDESSGRYLLKKGVDKKKDQSYFLYRLSQDQLKNTLFPLGNYSKEQVRKIAQEHNLPVASKSESQDFVCGDYAHFFKGKAVKPGQILDEQGQVLGEHKGIIHFTIGQRKQLGIATGQPKYVLKIDKDSQAIIVGPKERLYSKRISVSQLNWIAIPELTGPIELRARIRQQHQEALATVFPAGEAAVTVLFKEPQMAVTPGQAIVFYQDEVVVGGGTIDQAEAE